MTTTDLGQTSIAFRNNEKLIPMTNNPITNGFFRIRERVKTDVYKSEEGKSRVSYGLLTLSAKSEAQITALTLSVAQVFCFALIYYYKNGYPIDGVTVNTDEFIKVRGDLKDRKEAKKQLWEGVKALEKITLEYDMDEYIKRIGNRKLTRVEEAMLNLKRFPLLCGEFTEKQRSREITICFSPQFTRFLKQTSHMLFPSSLLTANPHRYPHIFSLCILIYAHKGMTSRFRNGKKTNNSENVLSVKSLLNAANLPCYKDAKGSYLINYRRDVITPIERSLSFFNDYFTWEYCHARGVPLDTSFSISPQKYDSLFVRFTFIIPIETTHQNLTNKTRVLKGGKHNAS